MNETRFQIPFEFFIWTLEIEIVPKIALPSEQRFIYTVIKHYFPQNSPEETQQNAIFPLSKK